MRLYADRPAVLLRQVLVDVVVVLWVVLAVRLGRRVHELVSALGAPGRGLQDAGDGLTSRAQGAGDAVDGTPVVGDDLRDAFDGFAGAGETISDAGRAQEAAADALATTLGLVVGGAFALVLLLPWLWRRVRWVRRATTVHRLAAEPAGRDLLAVRALATRPYRELRAVAPDPADAWRRGDEEAVGALAGLELARLGLRVPAR